MHNDHFDSDTSRDLRRALQSVDQQLFPDALALNASTHSEPGEKNGRHRIPSRLNPEGSVSFGEIEAVGQRRVVSDDAPVVGVEGDKRHSVVFALLL